MSQVAKAEAKKLQQQLTEVQAEANSAAQQVVSLTCQLTAMTHKAEASEEFVKMVLQQQQTDAQTVADALKLQQQLSDAQAVVDSAQSDAKMLQKQLSDASISADLDAKKVQQRLTDAQAVAGAQKLQQQLSDAQAAGESASADTKQVLQQQPIELQPSIEQGTRHMTAAHHAELLAKVPISPSDCADTL